MTTHSLTLTRTQAAEMIGVSTKTVDRLCARGTLPVARIGSRVVLHRQGVVDYLGGLFNLAAGEEPADAAADDRDSTVDPMLPELDKWRAERRNSDQDDLGKAA